MHTPSYDFVLRYLEAAVAGRRPEARRVLEEALASGLPPRHVVLEVLVPAQREIGTRWHRGEISIAEEHLATSVSRFHLEYLAGLFPRSRPNGRNVLIAILEDEAHSLPVQLLGYFFESEGWNPTVIKDSTPVESLIEMRRSQDFDLVVISVTNPSGVHHLTRVCSHFAELFPGSPVLAGGAGLDPSLKIENCVIELDLRTGLERARELVSGENAAPVSLDQILKTIGKRVQALRKARGMSQKDLGEHAQCERSYISAVESGRQNVTMSGLVRLAQALDISPRELLS